LLGNAGFDTLDTGLLVVLTALDLAIHVAVLNPGNHSAWLRYYQRTITPKNPSSRKPRKRGSKDLASMSVEASNRHAKLSLEVSRGLNSSWAEPAGRAASTKWNCSWFPAVRKLAA
jgi:hypothetical protein